MSEFKVGDYVRLVKTIIEPPDEHSPGGVLAREGETVVIRRFTEPKYTYTIAVSHEGVRDSSFLVSADEIELIEENTDLLAYDVKLEGWTRVAKALREFKKKRHKGFYLDVKDLGRDIYHVKVYKE